MKIPGSHGFVGDFLQTFKNDKTPRLHTLNQKLE